MQKRSRVYIQKVKRAKKYGRELGIIEISPIRNTGKYARIKSQLRIMDGGKSTGKFNKIADKSQEQIILAYYTPNREGVSPADMEKGRYL